MQVVRGFIIPVAEDSSWPLAPHSNSRHRREVCGYHPSERRARQAMQLSASVPGLASSGLGPRRLDHQYVGEKSECNERGKTRTLL